MDLHGTITIFLSIIIEALPFVLIGVLASSLIHLFVSEELIRRVLPANRFLRLPVASLLGILFPLCECGIIIIVRRLLQKGITLSTGMTFMLAVPIINPVVAASTHMAFPHIPMLYYRMGGAFVVALLIGVIVELFFNDSHRYLREMPAPADATGCSHTHCSGSGIGDGAEKGDTTSYGETSPGWTVLPVFDVSRGGIEDSDVGTGDEFSGTQEAPTHPGFMHWTRQILSHASEDLFVMGKFLIIGAFLAALIQTAVSRELLTSVGQGEASSIGVMMLLAYSLSICSEADAFVASSFAGTFLPASLTAFLLYGPMTDIKNTLVMLAFFKPRFVVIWLGLITVTVFLITYLQAVIL